MCAVHICCHMNDTGNKNNADNPYKSIQIKLRHLEWHGIIANHRNDWKWADVISLFSAKCLCVERVIDFRQEIKHKKHLEILAWSTGPRAHQVVSPSLRQGEKEEKDNLKGFPKPSQKRLKLIGCSLSQEFDKTLLHHLTFNGFAKSVIGLNILSWEETQIEKQPAK